MTRKTNDWGWSFSRCHCCDHTAPASAVAAQLCRRTVMTSSCHWCRKPGYCCYWVKEGSRVYPAESRVCPGDWREPETVTKYRAETANHVTACWAAAMTSSSLEGRIPANLQLLTATFRVEITISIDKATLNRTQRSTPCCWAILTGKNTVRKSKHFNSAKTANSSGFRNKICAVNMLMLAKLSWSTRIAFYSNR